MTSTKCPKCGTDMDPKKPCPECGHEIGAPKESEDGIKPPKIVEEDLTGTCKDSEDACAKKMDGKCPDGCKGKKGKADSVDRIDYWGPLNMIATESEAMKVTENGDLVGKAAIFGVGVYRYMGADGKVTAEFRPPEEVFSEATLDSYKLRPLTNLHPPEKVTPTNVSKYTVGNLGEEIEHDAYNAFACIIVQQAEAIAAAKAGRRGLSGGYSCDVITEGFVSYPVLDWEGKEIARTTYQIPGNFNGTPYDAIQTNIRGNHVALVDIPRGGDALHLRFDGADVGVGVRISDTQPTPTNQKESQMAKISLKADGDFEIPEAVKVHLDSLDAKVASLEAEKSTLSAKADSAAEALEAVKADAKVKEDGFDARVDAAVEARLHLASVAAKYAVDASGDIRAQVIAKAFPKANMDGKDEAYMAARFDSAIELLDSMHNDGTPAQLQQIQKPKEDGLKPESVEARMANAYKTSK